MKRFVKLCGIVAMMVMAAGLVAHAQENSNQNSDSNQRQIRSEQYDQSGSDRFNDSRGSDDQDRIYDDRRSRDNVRVNQSQNRDRQANRNDNRGGQNNARIVNSNSSNRWRYKRHNNEWWYWHPDNQWLFWRNGSWNQYSRDSYRLPQNDGFRRSYNNYNYYGNRSYDDGRFYNPGRFDDGYFGQRYYSGYRGPFSDSRYGQGFRYGGYSRGGNIGADVGGAIGGRSGAAIGSAIGRAID